MPILSGEIWAVLITIASSCVGWLIRKLIDSRSKNNPASKDYDFFINPLKEEISRLKGEYSHCLKGNKELNDVLDLLRAENLKLETQVYELQREVNKLNYELDTFYQN